MDTKDLKVFIDNFIDSYESKHYIKPVNDEDNCNLTRAGLVSVLFMFESELAELRSRLEEEETKKDFPELKEMVTNYMQVIPVEPDKKLSAEEIILSMNWTYDSDPGRFQLWTQIIKPAMEAYHSQFSGLREEKKSEDNFTDKDTEHAITGN